MDPWAVLQVLDHAHVVVHHQDPDQLAKVHHQSDQLLGDVAVSLHRLEVETDHQTRSTSQEEGILQWTDSDAGVLIPALSLLEIIHTGAMVFR